MKQTMKFIFSLFIVIIILPSYKYAQQLPQPDHIIIVIEENHGFNQIIGSSNAPYINSLANDTLGALFTNFRAETHPSQPNYLWLFSGDNQGVTNDNTPTDTPFTTANLGAELLQMSQTFGGYSEDLPYTGYQGTSSGAYKRKHNPWVNWQGDSTNGIPASLNMPFTDFPANYSTLPRISFVIPNQNNDMHDGTVAEGDTWLQDNLDGYIQWAKTHNSLFIFTFDEDEGSENQRIPTIFVGQMVKAGQYDEHINHVNLLRTLEDMYGLNHAGSAADSTSITDCWTNSVNAVGEARNTVNQFRLEQNYPNPFNPSTKIKYSIPSVSGALAANQHVTLKVYDVLGRIVATLVNENKPAGNYEVTFNSQNLPSGIYFYRLRINDNIQTRKMVLLK